MGTILTYDDLLHFPKVDLHRHIDGSVNPRVLVRLAERLGVQLPTYDVEEFKKVYRITRNMPINECLKRFAWAIAVMRTSEGLEEVAYQVVLDAAAENIRYLELLFAPSYHSFWTPSFYKRKEYEKGRRRVMDMHEVVMRTLIGIRRGELETGITANLIPCIPRECKTQYPSDVGVAIAELVVRFQHYGVVGIGLVCDEFSYPPDEYEDEYRRTFGTNIRRTAHADEMVSKDQGIKNMATCIGRLGVNGLSHVYHLHEHPNLMDGVRKCGIRIERHPLGFLAPPILEQGIDTMLDQGIQISIMSDDPALYGQTLTENLKAVLDAYSWGEKELHMLTANALRSAFFATPMQKQKVLDDFADHGLDIR